MANTPDFSYKPDATLIAAFQNANAQRMQQEQLDQQKKKQDFQMVKETTEAVSGMVSSMVEAAQARTKRNLVNDAKEILGQPKPAENVVEPMSGDAQAIVPNPAATQRKKALLDIAGALSPKDLGEQAAKAAFPEPSASTKPINLQSKSIMLNGQPFEALFNPDATGNQFLDPHTKQPLEGDIKPYSATTQTELTDADRKRLAPLAKAVIEGRALPSALVNARGGDKEKLAQVASELDPQFDLSLAPQRIATRKDFSSGGKSGQTLTSLNTVIGHLDTLDNKIEALDNGKIVKANQLGNYLKTEAGSPETTGFNAAKALVIGELGKIAQGSGVVTNEERQQFEQALNSAQSKEQAHEAIVTFMDLMKSRTDAIKSNWQQTMGDTTPPVPFINAKSKEKLIKHGYDPETLEKKEKPQAASNGLDDLARALGLQKRK